MKLRLRKGVILSRRIRDALRHPIEQKEEGMPRKKKSEEDEIDELVDSLDELDEEDVEDEDEDVEEEYEEEEEEEEEEDEDPDEAPKRTRSRKKKTTTKKTKTQQDGVGTAEVAAAAGIESRQLRMYLRSQNIQPGDDRDGRYYWPSLESREVKKILAAINKGAVDKLQKEKIASLKGKSKAKKSTAKSTAKSRKTRKTKVSTSK